MCFGFVFLSLVYPIFSGLAILIVPSVFPNVYLATSPRYMHSTFQQERVWNQMDINKNLPRYSNILRYLKTCLFFPNNSYGVVQLRWIEDKDTQVKNI